MTSARRRSSALSRGRVRRNLLSSLSDRVGPPRQLTWNIGVTNLSVRVAGEHGVIRRLIDRALDLSDHMFVC